MYRYNPLAAGRTIRRLILHPGREGRAIHVTLETASLVLTALAGYEALSYAWGDRTLTMPIFCDGSVILVTSNLFTALQYLRNEKQQRCLWIDAICINQSDPKEKSAQIPLMKYIYSGASRVVIWLGEEEGLSALAFSTIENWATWQDTPGNLVTERIQDGVEIYHQNLRSRMDSLTLLFECPWFHRSWTLQEVGLSGIDTVLLWGKLETSLAALFTAFLTASKANFGDLFDQFRDAMLVWYQLNKFGSGRPPGAPVSFSLSDLLHLTQLRTVSDPRDKIFCLLGLATGRSVLRLIPDYNLSVEDTFIRYTRAMIRDDENLNILSDTERMQPNPNLPSWVPDWTSDQLTYSLAAPKNSLTSLAYSLNRSISHKLTVSGERSRKLSLKGAQIDHVITVFPLDSLMAKINVKRYGLFHEWRAQVRAVSDLATQTGIGPCYNISAEIAEIAILRTLCTDFFPLSQTLPTDMKSSTFGYHNTKNLKRRCFPRRYSASIQASDNIVGLVPEPNSVDPLEDYLEPYEEHGWIADDEDLCSLYRALFEEERLRRRDFRLHRRSSDSEIFYESRMPDGPERTRVRLVQEACKMVRTRARGRNLFTTSKGFIGLGPIDMRHSDMVYSLVGGAVPYVLRSTGVTREYRLVGEAYVHGIMTGELWDGSPSASSRFLGGELNFKKIILV